MATTKPPAAPRPSEAAPRKAPATGPNSIEAEMIRLGRITEILDGMDEPERDRALQYLHRRFLPGGNRGY